ncbi:helix-turn-helix transcriptional regulator [Burkholderia territorii]|uniref:helix-turn-helix transcriptional regulator n=1 Tax=Burkholderia territorii TaxID=1503055 RepID=UPI00075AA5F5|nr:hypothetical protein [Burkholderia territorii]KWO55256.1 hypothetical protein WT98_08850 [Burkholderia territorii]
MSVPHLTHAFVLFDSYPDSAFVDVRTVGLLCGCAIPTVWRRVRLGIIPAPHRLGVSARWNVGELRKAFLAAKNPADER